MKEEKTKTIYCGGGKKMAQDWLSVTVHLDKAADYIFKYKDKTYLKLNINIMEEVNSWGKDVALSVNTYKPEGLPPNDQDLQKELVKLNDDLPF